MTAHESTSPADVPFSPVAAARKVVRVAPTGALATLADSGGPFASLVTVATSAGGEPVLLLSHLAVHSGNLAQDSRASLLLVAPGGEQGDPLAGARLTVTGAVLRDDEPELRRRFLARHEEAGGYADFPDFAVYRLAVASAHLVAGFGRIHTLSAADLLTDLSNCSGLVAAEAGVIAHVNEDHADALALYATRLLGMPDAAWQATGCDPDGMDLRAGPLRARLDFPAKVLTPGDLRRTLVELAGKARAMA